MQTATDRVDHREGGRVDFRRLPRVALLAAAVAAAANALVYFASSAAGAIPRDVPLPSPTGESPMTVGLVVLATIVGAAAAAAVFAIIGRFARRPVGLFVVVATVVLALSFASPLTIPGAPLAMILSMETMHLVAWAAIVGLLTTLARKG